MIDDKELYSVSDNAHFLAGIVVPTVVQLLHGRALWGFAAIIVFAAIKEGYWDPRYESKEIAGSGFRDFTGYLLGAIVGMVIVELSRL